MPERGEILFVAYGGGHMRMLVPVAGALADQGLPVRLLPLTVGVTDAAASGLPMTTLSAAVEAHPDVARFRALGEEIAPNSGHPAVSEMETQIYHGIGLASLIDEMGEAAGRAAFRARGRAAFAPTAVWRWLLQALAPAALVSTTAPRSEKAALEAAGALGLPSVCVTDHFLVYEMDYVARAGHGDRICVLGHAVADTLTGHGRPGGEIRVTGNPAFDELFDPALKDAARAWRRTHGLEGARVILWPQESGIVQVRGKPLFDNPPIRAVLDTVLGEEPGTRLVIRPHPNRADAAGVTGGQVRIDRDTPIAVLVHAADVVVQQCTTVGLQAALCGTPVLTLGNGEMPPFARYGLATDLDRVEDLAAALRPAAPPDPALLGATLDGGSAARVAEVVREVLAR